MADFEPDDPHNGAQRAAGMARAALIITCMALAILGLFLPIDLGR